MPTVDLSERAVIDVDGEDAESFLQNLITTNLDDLARDDLKPGALLSPQGKILFQFLVSRRASGGFRLDLPQAPADDLVKRLTLYRLRATVAISKQSEALVRISFGDDSAASQTESTYRDRRFAAEPVYRVYGAAPAVNSDEREWTLLRIRHGVAEAPADFALGDAFPHDINFDQIEGVSFRKGCFVGQEVVSRMQHRGTARRRVLIASAEQSLPEAGTPVTVNGREIGTLGSTVGNIGLALVRIDRVKDAMDGGAAILAGDIAIRLAIPPEHRFTFPAETQEA